VEDLSYPIGRFERPQSLGRTERDASLTILARTPSELQRVIAGLDAKRLDSPYRPGGWTVRQVVHHLPDSHMNAYIRFRLALTEDGPAVKVYDEARWAALPDARFGSPEVSLRLLAALHERWVALLKSVDEAGWERVYKHPELGDVRLDVALAMYDWHSRHHLAHITRLCQREGWV
jgi:hypothetical protein